MFDMVGTVVHGEQRGRQLGYPTANLDLPDASPFRTGDAPMPSDGVYGGVACVREHDGTSSCWVTAISIGTNPTFGGVDRTVEAHLLDFDGDLYGRRLELHGGPVVRPMRSFASVAALVEQMDRDVQYVRERVNITSHPHAGLA